MRTGIIFVTNPSLDMIVSPHLLSLANGFGRVDSELARLASPACGYLEYTKTLAAHVATLNDGEIALAFGRVPCICASQGTVERKLEAVRKATLVFVRFGARNAAWFRRPPPAHVTCPTACPWTSPTPVAVRPRGRALLC